MHNNKQKLACQAIRMYTHCRRRLLGSSAWLRIHQERKYLVDALHLEECGRKSSNLDLSSKLTTWEVQLLYNTALHLCKLSCNTKFGDVFAQKPSASGGFVPGPLTPFRRELDPWSLPARLSPGHTWGRGLSPYIHPEPNTKLAPMTDCPLHAIHIKL